MTEPEPPPKIDPEDLGALVGSSIFMMPGAAQQMVGALARQIAGPFGGFVTIGAEQMRNAHGYIMRVWVKEVEAVGQTVTLEIIPPPVRYNPESPGLLRTRG